MKRFDVLIDGPANRDYCEDGEFVDAGVAEELYEALDALVSELDDNEPPDGQWHGSPAQNQSRAALAKAKGEQA